MPPGKRTQGSSSVRVYSAVGDAGQSFGALLETVSADAAGNVTIAPRSTPHVVRYVDTHGHDRFVRCPASDTPVSYELPG